MSLFGVDLECGIKTVNVKTEDVDGRILRRCRVTLTHEFDAAIARALGKDAQAVWQGLRGGGIKKAELPIDSIAAHGAFTSVGDGDIVAIGTMVGTKATCTQGKEDSPPLIALEFEFAWQEDAWLFLGRNCAAMASLFLTQRQTELPIPAQSTGN